MRHALLFAILAVGCSTMPERQKPTPEDCVKAKDQVDVLVAKARLNAPWSKADVDTIAAQGSALKRHIDQFAEAAGIATTVPAAQGKAP